MEVLAMRSWGAEEHRVGVKKSIEVEVKRSNKMGLPPQKGRDALASDGYGLQRQTANNMATPTILI